MLVNDDGLREIYVGASITLSRSHVQYIHRKEIIVAQNGLWIIQRPKSICSFQFI